jgi:hypothetical protein
MPGLNQTIPRKRHTPLSEQFQEVANNLHAVRNWLKTETLVKIKTEALLPDLQKQLENSGLQRLKVVSVVHGQVIDPVQSAAFILENRMICLVGIPTVEGLNVGFVKGTTCGKPISI